MIEGYISLIDWEKLLKLLDDPEIICPSCSNKPDCEGQHECFNRHNYKYIKIRVDRTKFWGQPPISQRDERSDQGGAGGLDQLEQIEDNQTLEESDQIKEGQVDFLGEVD